MYELLNIRNKFKGKRLYYCSFRDYGYYSSNPILRKVFIRLVTYADDNMILVGENFRIEIQMKELVTNRSFSMRVGDNRELRIISTEKQEVARFIKDYYCTSMLVAWGYSFHNTAIQDEYKKLMEQLKKL